MLQIKELQSVVKQVMQSLEKTHQQSSSQLNHFGSQQTNSQKSPLELIRKQLDSKNKTNEDRIFNEIFKTGPLENILNNSSITEILVNQHDSIWYEQEGVFKKLKDQFATKHTYYNFIQRICQKMGQTFDLNQPHIDGTWRDFRVHIISPPLSQEVHLSLRHHPKNFFCLDVLKKMGWCNDLSHKILTDLVFSKKNILVVGSTGTGKTSLISALLQETSNLERSIILEDVDEICLPNSLSLKLLTRENTSSQMKDYSLNDLVKQSLRMRPQRLVMGEIRGTEAKDLLLMLSSGHRGSMSTIHASSAKDALLRLEVLVQMGAPDWSLHTIRHLIKSGLDTVVLLDQFKNKRYLKSISKILCLEQHGLILETLYKNNY